MSSFDTQIGGTHYKDMPIQPVVFCEKNKLSFCEGNIVKYVTRWRSKGGIQDLQKARHYLDMLLDIAQEEASVSYKRNS